MARWRDGATLSGSPLPHPSYVTTLRVLISAPPAASRADEWALYDAQGKLTRHGRDTPQRWPAALRREAVIAADDVRLIALTLPPMPASRVAAAARFALEDQLAGPADAHAIALTHVASGSALARIAAQSLVGALRREFSRVIAEPELAQTIPGWRWCARPEGGFVRRADGSAFACGASEPEGGVPLELTLAIAQAERQGAAPAEIVADVAEATAHAQNWQAQTGIAFRAGNAWKWYEAPATAFAAATDLAGAGEGPAPRPQPGGIARLFAPALMLLALALALHIAATAGTWVTRRIEVARGAQALADLATAAGLPDATSENAARLLAHHYALARHRAGLAVSDDGMPLLARAASALAALPAGTLKRARYAGAAWTFELTALDDRAIDALEQRLAVAGLPAVHARHADGVRVRVGPGS